MLSMRLIIFLTGLGLVATLQAASPTPPESPPITPVSARKHSFKDAVPFEAPGDSIVARHTGFEVVPGKDPNGWAFIIEPYLWGLGVDGTIGLERFDTHVDYNPVTVVKHLDWGIMAKGEVRKGKWGILGDGFFAQLSASGDPPGPLYNNANIKLQQGMAELALAYRIIDDRRGFLDIYAGARYNYFGLHIDASVDEEGVQEVSDDAAQRTFRAVRSSVQSAVDAEVQRSRVQLANERAVLGEDVRLEEAILRGDVQAARAILREDAQAERNILREDVRVEEAVLREDVRTRIAGSLESDLQARLSQDLTGNRSLQDALGSAELRRVTRGIRSELRTLLNAVLDARLTEERARVGVRLAEDRRRLNLRLAEDRARVAVRLAEDRRRINARLTRVRARVDARLGEARGRIDAAAAQASASAQARVAQAEKKFAKALSEEIEDRLPTSKSGDQWWVDPIIGLRTQINFTRWLFLALQGDVGGFGAGSQIAWFASGSIGFNLTRNIFLETGYRYFYMDYTKNGLIYDAAQSGLFTGVGVKF